MQNHFELFQLPARFAIDLAQLDQAYRDVQSQVHPDKFVQASGAEKRVAMQWATRANEAYQTLKNPIKRATYLCQLHHIDIEAHSNTSMPAAFLMQQIEWREAMEEAQQTKNPSALYAIEDEIRQALKQQLALLTQALDQDNFTQAAKEIRVCLFLEKFLADIAAIDE
jgi:molecular chaperone HscB